MAKTAIPWRRVSYPNPNIFSYKTTETPLSLLAWAPWPTAIRHRLPTMQRATEQKCMLFGKTGYCLHAIILTVNMKKTPHFYLTMEILIATARLFAYLGDTMFIIGQQYNKRQYRISPYIYY